MLRLHDEATGALRGVELGPRMTVYVCGITPYDSAHLGHAFTYVHFDVLVRYLRHLGADVVHAQNVTDVDDDILRVARERGIDHRKLAEQETASFERAMSAIGVQPPSFTPLVSEFVPAIVEEVAALVAARHGYERDGTVYFPVSSYQAYGQLSGLSREEMLPLAAERGGHPEDPNKDDPLDFVLWQRSLPGEPWWESPWGRGRPGWHIECSTMARRLLGQPIDIHGGGTDLVFPHHESEIAQAESLPGDRPFVRHWMHTGTVYYNGDKMSKSLGNLAFVADLIERHDPLKLRRFLLTHHYRSDWTFSESELERFAPSAALPGAGGRAQRQEFFDALDDDLDTPRALEILYRAAASADPESEELIEEGSRILGI